MTLLPQSILILNGRTVFDGRNYSFEISPCYKRGGKSAGYRRYTGDGHVIRGGERDTLEMARFAGGFFDAWGNAYYYVYDYRGSVSAVMNSEGNIEHAYNYYPYGELWIEPETRSGIRTTKAVNQYTFGDKERLTADGIHEYDQTARRYAPAYPLFTTPDALAAKTPHLSPYAFCAANPVNSTDPDGRFPIFINGLSNKSQHGKASYWCSQFRNLVKQKTGYNHSQFMFVNGDRGWLPSQRFNAGLSQGKADAYEIYRRLKSSAKDGVINEQLQIISHSRGSAFASGYMKSIVYVIQNLAKNDNISFSYGEDKIIEYSINIAPHQSNFISYEESGTINVNISHYGDFLSGNDALGNVINIHSCMVGFDQHGHETYIPELEFVLPIMEAGGSKNDIMQQLINLYNQWSQLHPNMEKSTVE